MTSASLLTSCVFFLRVLETKVAVGGWLVQNGEHVKTSPIVNRLDIHKVLTEDGVEVSLEGTIDQETSTANGFAPGIVQCLSAGKFTVDCCRHFVQYVMQQNLLILRRCTPM